MKIEEQRKCEYCGRSLPLVVDDRWCQELCKYAREVYEKSEYVVNLFNGKIYRRLTSQIMLQHREEFFEAPVTSKNVRAKIANKTVGKKRSIETCVAISEAKKKQYANEDVEERDRRIKRQKLVLNTELALKNQSDARKLHFIRETTEQKAKRIENQTIAQNRVKVLEKKSEDRSLAIAENRFHPFSNHVHGYYKNVYFSSSYELRAMIMFDIRKIKWTRNVMRISWYDSKKKRISKYTPDFIVNDNEIWETKGWVDKEKTVFVKAEAARKFVEERSGEYAKYRLLFDKELIEEEKIAATARGWSFERYQRHVKRVVLCYKLKIEKRT